jgi:hypothetical protein
MCSATTKEREEKKAKKRTGRKKVCVALGKLTIDDGGKRSSSSVFYSTGMSFVRNERERTHTHNEEEEKLSIVV